MIQDRNDQYDAHEEGEYHFSDDQTNYDFEPETPRQPAPKAPANVARLKKIGTGVVAFLVLIFLVFRLLAPSAPTTAVIPAAKSFSAHNKPAMSPTPAVAAAVPASTPQVPSQEAQPQAMAPSMSETPAIAAAMPPVAPPLQQAAPEAPPPQAAPAPQPMPETQTRASAPSPALVIAPESTSPNNTIQPPPSTESSDARLAEMQADNAKAQAELTQKLATVTAQNQTLQTEVQQLTSHLTALETAMARLNQNLQEAKLARPSQQALASAGAMGVAPQQTNNPVLIQPQPEVKRPHMAYTVQAIIPGRAWLKSDNGETVTVAEGDVIREFGRVVKIDPYDGVVDIDMNGKLVSLSYGAGAE